MDGGKRSGGGRRGQAVLIVAAVAAAFHLYGAGIAPFTALVQRPVHLALMGTLALLGVGVRALPRSRAGWGFNVALGALLVASALYLVSQNEALVARSGSPTVVDLVAGAVVVAAVLLLAWRATGWGLVAVATAALLYALSGPWLPGVLAHRGYDPGRLIEQLFLSTEGIWGVPLGVSADFVYLFVLFGAFLDIAGGGGLLIGLADRVAGRTRGGPAKTAAVASAFMGSLSGSAVANVVTTGTFTIPLMRRSGFRPFFAGAIEAAASTGGQLMPPVMGAGAFILATWTNIPYGKVALAAAIPAVLYYAALLWAIHLRAAKVGIEGSAAARSEAVLARLHLLLPVAIIVLMLALGRSPMRAAFWGVVTSVLAAYAVRHTRPGLAAVAKSLRSAASGAVQVAAACAAAGIVVGVASADRHRVEDVRADRGGLAGQPPCGPDPDGPRLDRAGNGSPHHRRVRGAGRAGRARPRGARGAAAGRAPLHLLLRVHLQRDAARLAGRVRRRRDRGVAAAEDRVDRHGSRFGGVPGAVHVRLTRPRSSWKGLPGRSRSRRSRP